VCVLSIYSNDPTTILPACCMCPPACLLVCPCAARLPSGTCARSGLTWATAFHLRV
jgi:hypothetical protein